MLGLLLYFGDEAGEAGVEFAGKARVGRFFVVDAAAQSFVGFSEGLNSGEDVGVGGVVLGGTELRDGKGEGGHELLLGVDDVGRKINIEQRRVRRERAGMLVLIAMR